MRKGLTILGLLFIILVVFGEVCMPQLLQNVLTTKAEKALATSDFELKMHSAPNFLMALGQVDNLQAVAHQGKVGQVFIRELTLTGRNVRFSVPDLLNSGQVNLSAADDLTLQGLVDEENLREVLSRRIERAENLQVKIEPELITVTAEAKLFGQRAEVELSGRVIEDLGTLYFQMAHLSLKNSRLGTAKLDGIFGDMFGDVLLFGKDQLPLGLKLCEVEQGNGVIRLKATRL